MSTIKSQGVITQIQQDEIVRGILQNRGSMPLGKLQSQVMISTRLPKATAISAVNRVLHDDDNVVMSRDGRISLQ